MSTHTLPPNPCLIAILLVVKTTSDPFIVFHYPPRPGEDNSRFKDVFKDNALNDQSTTSSSDEDSQDSITDAPKTSQEKEDDRKKNSPPEGDEFGSASPEKGNGLRLGHKWNDLFGYQSSVLAKLLCPAATSHKKRFEVGLNDKVMIGRPVFARTDGTWKKAKKARRSSSRSNMTAEKTRLDREEIRVTKAKYLGVEEKDHEPSEPETPAASQSHMHDEVPENILSVDPQVEKEAETKRVKGKSSVSSLPPKPEKPLVIFNVVYVLQPPPLEYHLRVKEMYDNVVKKLSKALKWEQSHSSYVANEAALITSIANRMANAGSEWLSYDL